jgi:hypothetical protein
MAILRWKFEVQALILGNFSKSNNALDHTSWCVSLYIKSNALKVDPKPNNVQMIWILQFWHKNYYMTFQLENKTHHK